MKKSIFLLAPLCAMLMVGCVKDSPHSNFIKLYAEGFTPDQSAKAAVKDSATYWVNGDDVWINNYKYEVVTSGSEAVVPGVYESPDNIYRAVYPASILRNCDGTNITVNVPRLYIYISVGQWHASA